MNAKTTVLILGTPGMTQLMETTLGSRFDVETLAPNNGASGTQFDPDQAKAKLLSHPNIRKVFVVPHHELCDGAKQVIAFAARLGKRSTVIGDADDTDAVGRLRNQSAAIGAGFLSSDFDHDTLLATVTASIGQRSRTN